jgi:hypothetical protein
MTVMLGVKEFFCEKYKKKMKKINEKAQALGYA